MYLVARPRPLEPRTVISTHSSPTRTEMLPPGGSKNAADHLGEEIWVLPPPRDAHQTEDLALIDLQADLIHRFYHAPVYADVSLRRPLALIIGSPSSTSSRLAKVPAMARN